MRPRAETCNSPALGFAFAGPLGVGLLCLLLSGPGCALPTSPTMATVPPEWRDANPWGPEANAAREVGILRPLTCPPVTASLAEFARRNIEDGDILFRYGASYRLRDYLVSRVVTKISDGRSSHVAIACREGD